MHPSSTMVAAVAALQHITYPLTASNGSSSRKGIFWSCRGRITAIVNVGYTFSLLIL